MNDIANQNVGFGRIAAMIPVKDMARAYHFTVKFLVSKKSSKTEILSAL